MFPSRPGSVPVVGLAGDNALAQSRAMTAVADRHLLFGLLALQNGLINQGQLVAAFEAWTLDKSRSLADHLEARGDLTPARRALMEGLAAVHLEAHGGDMEKSLAGASAGK
jgi:eukaryotic-like serine/threonine-protein kinase